ncbi:hypothetical protein, partial [Achromobacter xylosoxidans]|uniref:hypothetical protein n=1 Tax=Alcaligenes xylosoxydans xylosoxydans TaxID=85698 RepID=UPI001F222F30
PLGRPGGRAGIFATEFAIKQALFLFHLPPGRPCARLQGFAAPQTCAGAAFEPVSPSRARALDFCPFAPKDSHHEEVLSH